jgi:hypothetical protein
MFRHQSPCPSSSSSSSSSPSPPSSSETDDEADSGQVEGLDAYSAYQGDEVLPDHSADQGDEGMDGEDVVVQHVADGSGPGVSGDGARDDDDDDDDGEKVSKKLMKFTAGNFSNIWLICLR